MKMNMYLIKKSSCLSTRDLQWRPGDDASSGTNTTCDAIVCDVGYGVEKS